MEKNKIRKGDEKEWWAWVRLSFKLRWFDLWVSGERTVQTQGAARAEALQQGAHGGRRGLSKGSTHRSHD